ncbi:unnamed protein product [Prunus armeniaca]
MGVLSSVQQLDESSVKLWNSLPKEKMGGYGGIRLEIVKVSGVKDEVCYLNVVLFDHSGWVIDSLGFQGFCEAGPSHGDEAPPAFLLGFPIRARRGKENG